VLLVGVAPAGGSQQGSDTALAEPELVTDRPDQTESTAIVPTGRAQLEIGATRTYDDASGVELETLEVPATLLRYGLGERVELRLGWSGWIDQEVRAGAARESADGIGDAEVGAKVLLREGGGVSPRVAVIAATSVPAGDDAFSSDRFDPSARLTVSHDLAGGIGLGWNIGVETASGPAVDRGRTTLSTAIYTLAAGFPAGEKMGVFAELFGEVPMSAPGDPAHLVDAGVTYLLRPHLQLDVAGGVGLSDDAPDWFAGVGVSVRLPR
jgi:hypothetical protein